MILTVTERLGLLGLLPAEGDFITLKIVRDLQDSLGFSEEELVSLEMEQDGDQIKWSTETAEDKDIEIGTRGQRLIADRLQELDGEKKLTQMHLVLYEQFVAD